MIVTIEQYDGAKGKGTLRTASGEAVPFTYTQFCGQVAIPEGARAYYHDGVLHPYRTPCQYLIWWLKEVMQWL